LAGRFDEWRRLAKLDLHSNSFEFMKRRKRQLESSSNNIIASSIRLIRLIQSEGITADKLSPEDYARMVRLKEVIDQILQEET
jgi:hypothetical protein